MPGHDRITVINPLRDAVGDIALASNRGSLVRLPDGAVGNALDTPFLARLREAHRPSLVTRSEAVPFGGGGRWRDADDLEALMLPSDILLIEMEPSDDDYADRRVVYAHRKKTATSSIITVVIFSATGNGQWTVTVPVDLKREYPLVVCPPRGESWHRHDDPVYMNQDLHKGFLALAHDVHQAVVGLRVIAARHRAKPHPKAS